MKSLIGVSGFVGSSLLRQQAFDHLYRSNNIATIDEKKHDLVICAAAPAQKWIANREPVADLKNIELLIAQLDKISCQQFVLISTVDVFTNPAGVSEATRVEEAGLHPYGLHRRQLEQFVEQRFDEHLILRLPGLVGPGLRKNVIFDFLNSNNVQAIDSRHVFQFYPTVNMWSDIQIALESKLSLLHLTAEPISVADVSMGGFGQMFCNELEGESVCYDFQSQYAGQFGGNGPYQYSKRETLQAIRTYAQSEKPTIDRGQS